MSEKPKSKKSQAAPADENLVSEEPEKKNKKKRSQAQKEMTAARRFWRKLRIIVIVLFIVAALIAGGIMYAGYRVSTSETNYPNVCIGEVNVGGMNRAETLAALDSYGWNRLAAEKFTVNLPMNISEKLVMSESGVLMQAEDAADLAYAYGHSGDWRNWFGNLKTYLQSVVRPVDITKDRRNIQSDYIYQRLDRAIKEFDRLMTTDEEYRIDEESSTLYMLKGANQLKIDREALYNAVVTAMENGEKSYECKVGTEGIKAPDFDKIYETLAIEPQDAYFDYETKEIVDSVEGFSFDTENAKKLWDKAEICTIVAIPVEILEPEITGEYLDSILFADILGKMTTGFSGSSANRINNLELACSKIDGIILNPGEIFSYNETLGRRTEEAGFLPAGAYADGEVVEEVGGGICQVSSTLYAATLYARLHTVARTNHYFAVAYMDKGIDATVSWPNPDFKFQNNTDYPIMIKVWIDKYDARNLTVAIMGTDVDHYSCKLWHESFSHTEDYEYDGNIYHDVNTATVTCTWRDVYDQDGNYLFREAVNRDADGDVYYDYYYFHKEDIIAKLPKLPSDSGGGESGEGSISIE